MEIPAVYLDHKLAQCDKLLNQDDRASRFIILFLVLEVMSRQPSATTATQAWQKLDGRFLDQLLLTVESESVAKSEASDMTELSLSVLHAFAGFATVAKQRSFVKRSDALLEYLLRRSKAERMLCLNETSQRIFAILQSIASSSEGASYLSTSKRLKSCSGLIINCESESGLRMLALCIDRAARQAQDVFTTWHEQLFVTLTEHQWKGNTFLKATALMNAIYLADAMQRSIQDDCKCKDLVKAALLQPVKGMDYADALLLITLILQRRSVAWLNLADQTERSFAVILGSLAAAEVRSRLSTISLQDTTESARLSDTDQVRLASSYDLMYLLCFFLASDDDGPGHFSPDQILRLRDDLCAAYSESILYLRETWDRSAQSSVSAVFKQSNDVEADLCTSPSISACVRALCFWLQEEESLHREAVHIMDVLISSLEGYRRHGSSLCKAILGTVDALVQADDGRNAFNTANGWPVIERLLQAAAQLDAEGPGSLKIDQEDVLSCLSILTSVNGVRFDAWMDRHPEYSQFLI